MLAAQAKADKTLMGLGETVGKSIGTVDRRAAAKARRAHQRQNDIAFEAARKKRKRERF